MIGKMVNEQLISSIDRCCRGDTEPFEAIVEEYQQLVYTLGLRMLGDEADARDATQETFIKVWLNLNKYNAQYKFSTWIYKIASNICCDKLRALRKISTVAVDHPNLLLADRSYDDLDHRELCEVVERITQSLTPKQKLVFTLSEIEELEVEEISTITGLSPAKIKSNLYLARKHVKEKIVNYERY